MDFLIAVLVLIAWGAAAYLKKNGKPSAAAKRGKPFENAGERGMSAPLRPAAPPPDMPDAACIVCDNTGEDHFAHDKARRIAQLDDFLKNGIIDKAEYRTLRDRYERNL